MDIHSFERKNNVMSNSGWIKPSFRFKLSGMWNKSLKLLKDNLLLCTTIVGVLLGFALGFIVREYSPTDKQLIWIGLPGQLYLRMFKMMVVPLIICAVINDATNFQRLQRFDYSLWKKGKENQLEFKDNIMLVR